MIRLKTIVDAVTSGFDVLSGPRDMTIVVIELALASGWANSEDEAAEIADALAARALLALQTLHAKSRVGGRHIRFDFNSSSDYLIQGACFAEPGDSDDIKEAKRRRSLHAAYQDFLANIDHREFEAVCRGILSVIGCKTATLTSHGNDQGIDFYGRLHLEGRLENQSTLPGVDRNLRMWIVGQAKHYKKVQSATPELRELVGSVELARTKTFASVNPSLADLDIAACDPVLFLFLTTGSISSDGWRLIDSSGMVAMDGPMVADFLADNDIGTIDDLFDESTARVWLAAHLAA